MPKMIFHYPGAFFKTLDTGEKKRPKTMYEEFKKLGYEVTSVVGTYEQRKAIVSNLKNKITEYDFIYSENSNLPLRLTNDKRYPYPFSPDITLHKMAKKYNIPSGVYYRDIYWRFDTFRQDVGIAKYLLALPFYKEEFSIYKKYTTKIFLQSQEFSKLLSIDEKKISYLPPGGYFEKGISLEVKGSPLNVVYVGSIKPPIYDLSEWINILRDFPQITFFLITREDDWKNYASYYNVPKNVKVHHVSGEGLIPFFKKADIFTMYFNENQYRKIMVPLKLFEAIAYALPIITCRDTASSSFVKENNIGWIVEPDNAKSFIAHLIESPKEIEEMKKNIIAIQKKHTWEARAKKVEKVLGFET